MNMYMLDRGFIGRTTKRERGGGFEPKKKYRTTCYAVSPIRP